MLGAVLTYVLFYYIGKNLNASRAKKWSVSSMPNGDIVTGSSDGAVRVFSAAEERWASSIELKEYDELVASQALPS